MIFRVEEELVAKSHSKVTIGEKRCRIRKEKEQDRGHMYSVATSPYSGRQLGSLLV